MLLEQEGGGWVVGAARADQKAERDHSGQVLRISSCCTETKYGNVQS